MSNIRSSCWFVVALLLSLATCFRPHEVIADDTFSLVTSPQPLPFPRSHGAHPDYKTEWWYFTGHLTDEASETYGFELTFFRVGLSRSKSDGKDKNTWRTGSLLLAHAALTIDSSRRFLFDERIARPHLGIAGFSEDKLRVWIDDWKVEQLADGSIRVQAAASPDNDDTFSFDLTLSSSKAPVLQGDRGYSVKGANPGDASQYISLTRLLGSGTLSIGDTKRTVKARAWMDHEFSSSKLSREVLGWDWFALQLASGEDIMLYQLRDSDGNPTPFSSGTIVATDGTSTRLNANEFRIEVLDRWRSPRTHKLYPSRWKLSVPKVQAEFVVTPTVAGQELVTDRTTGVTYWEGRSMIKGTLAGNQTEGEAYVELVGYE